MTRTLSLWRKLSEKHQLWSIVLVFLGPKKVRSAVRSLEPGKKTCSHAGEIWRGLWSLARGPAPVLRGFREPTFLSARSLEPSKKPCSHAVGIWRGRDWQAPMKEFLQHPEKQDDNTRIQWARNRKTWTS